MRWFFKPEPSRETHINVWRATDAYTDADIATWCNAIQKQVDTHFAPFWKQKAVVSFARVPTFNAWQI